MTNMPSVPVESNRRRNMILAGAAALIALALVAFMITSVTRAAWTDTTENAGNAWATGHVELTDDDGDQAMFEITNMMPGDVETNSIVVTNASSVALNVKMYGTAVSGDSALASELLLEVGTASDNTDVYTGPLGDFPATLNDGTAPIPLGDSGTQEYHFTVTLPSDASTDVQNMTTGITFVWEGQTQ